MGPLSSPGFPCDSQPSKTELVGLDRAQVGCHHLVHLRCPWLLETLPRAVSYNTGPMGDPRASGEVAGVQRGYLGASQWLRMLVYGNWAPSLRSDSTLEKDAQLSMRRLH